MEMSFVKVHVDALEAYKRLSDAEFGRALRAVLQYIKDGTEEELSGKDSIMYDVLRQQVERDRASYGKKVEANRGNGSRGGRPRKNPKNPLGFSETQRNPKNPLGFSETQKTQEKEKEIIPPYPPAGDAGGGGSLTDGEAEALQAGLDSVLTAAEEAGFADSDRTRSTLNLLCADFSAAWVLAAIGEAADSAHGKPSIALLRAILDRYRHQGSPEGRERPPKANAPNDGYAFPRPADWSKAELV